MSVLYPPLRRMRRGQDREPSVFLGGSIEMGAASNWQTRMINDLQQITSIIYNPRRPDWDPTWEQDVNHPEFNAQVHWELDMIDASDIVLFYFEPTTKAPITLQELGYVAGRGLGDRVLVCCPEGYWRRGNVDIMCERERFHTSATFDRFRNDARAMVDRMRVAMREA